MTEDEAKTKWCPFGAFNNCTTGTTMPSSSHYTHTVATPARCIASACMVWRPTESWDYWETEEKPNFDDCSPEGPGWDNYAKVKKLGEGTMLFWRRPAGPPCGTCGLAVKP